MTYCKVEKDSDGVLKLKGEGFNLEMKYNPKDVTPEIEYNEINDSKLKYYWPKGVTRIVFNIKNPGIKGKNQIEILEDK